MSTSFYKLSGSGNDFVMLDGREHQLADWSQDRIAEVCARGTGIGADGFVVLEPGSIPDSVRFNFYNSDGSRAPMCGNGALCATRLAGELQMAPKAGMTLQTDAGDYRTAWASDNGSKASIWLEDAIPSDRDGGIALNDAEDSVFFMTVGVPHLVLKVKDVDLVDVLSRGRELRHHASVMPLGSNVNFVSGSPESGWKMRTYERGVEDETLACGTGAVASVAVLASVIGSTDEPIVVQTRSGLELKVAGQIDSGGSAWLRNPVLTGNAKIVFSGSFGEI